MSVLDPIRAQADLWHTAPALPSRPVVYRLFCKYWIVQLGTDWRAHHTWREAMATANGETK